MDIRFSFLMAGVENDCFIFTDIDLTSDIDVSSSSFVSSFNSIYLGTHNSERIASSINLGLVVILGLIMLSTISIVSKLSFARLKKNKKKANARQILNNIRRVDPLKRKNFRKALLKIILYASVIITWDIILLFSQLTINLNDINTGNYNFRYIVASLSSMIFFIIGIFLIVLPLLTPRTFPEFSSKKGMNSLAISLLSLIGLVIWANTSIITYEIGESVTFIRDTFPTFIPLIILSLIFIFMKCIDLIIYSNNKHSFDKLRYRHSCLYRINEERPANAQELTLLVLQAVKYAKEPRSISQIKKYIRSIGTVTVTRNGISLNMDFVKKLMLKLYIVRRNDIFHLTPKGLEILKEHELDYDCWPGMLRAEEE